jgi:transmembrane sensor
MPDPLSEELAGWLDRLEHERTPELERAFATWLNESPARQHEYEQIELQTEYLRAARRRSEYTRTVEASRRRRVKIMAASVGAIAAAAAAVAWIVTPVGSTVLPGEVLQTAALTRPIRFADGTIGILAMSAQAVAEMGGTHRQIVLQGGSARFIVAPDARRPMIIKAPGLEIRARSGTIDIVVNGSRVRATTRDADAQMRTVDPVELPWVAVSSGQSLRAGQAAVVPAPADPVSRIAVLEADGLAVRDLLAIVNSDADHQILVADPMIGARRVTGRFHVRDRRALARKVAEALDLRLAERGSTLILHPR